MAARAVLVGHVVGRQQESHRAVEVAGANTSRGLRRAVRADAVAGPLDRDLEFLQTIGASGLLPRDLASPIGRDESGNALLQGRLQRNDRCLGQASNEFWRDADAPDERALVFHPQHAGRISRSDPGSDGGGKRVVTRLRRQAHAAEGRAAVRRESLEVEDLLTARGQGMEKIGLPAARKAGEHDEPAGGSQRKDARCLSHKDTVLRRKPTENADCKADGHAVARTQTGTNAIRNFFLPRFKSGCFAVGPS